jgi:autotransporter-associated beta strand protein
VTSSGSLLFNRSDAVTVANSINGSGSLTQMGADLLILSGTSTYTGRTTVASGTLEVSGSLHGTAEIEVQSGATFRLGGSDVINNSATVTLAGGTLRTSGFSEGSATSLGLGTFRLTASSTLDFGSSNTSQLLFSGFDPLVAGTLSIFNWDGAASGPSDADRFMLLGNNVARLSFESAFAGRLAFDGFNTFSTVQYDTYFEVVAAVPEPSSLMLGTIAVGLLGFRRRRKN